MGFEIFDKMELEPLNVNFTSREMEDQVGHSEMWYIIRGILNNKKSAFFIHLTGKDAYALVQNLSSLSILAQLS